MTVTEGVPAGMYTIKLEDRTSGGMISSVSFRLAEVNTRVGFRRKKTLKDKRQNWRRARLAVAAN